MSINDFMNKIKGQIGIDRNTLLTLLILVFVGIGSFGLGRLERGELIQKSNIKLDNTNVIPVKEEIGKSNSVESSDFKIDTNSRRKMYVASKNGKLYYGVNCSGANRIKIENQMWFATTLEAEDSGFSKAASCK